MDSVRNVSVYFLAWVCTFIYFTFTLWRRLLGYLVDVYVIFRKSFEYFPKWLYHLTFQQWSLLQCVSSSHANQNVIICHCYFSRCIVTSHFVFYLIHCLMASGHYVLISHYSFFELSSQIFFLSYSWLVLLLVFYKLFISSACGQFYLSLCVVPCFCLHFWRIVLLHGEFLVHQFCLNILNVIVLSTVSNDTDKIPATYCIDSPVYIWFLSSLASF